MDGGMLSNLTDPAILFFLVGIFIGVVRSNLEIPAPVAKFVSLYLVMVIGFRGGQALNETGLTGPAVKVLVIALIVSLAMPALGFVMMRRKVNDFDAAAIAATYGSVSMVTFIAGTEFVKSQGTEVGGYLAIAAVVMESPAIIMCVLLGSWARARALATNGEVAADPLPGASPQPGGEPGGGSLRTQVGTVTETQVVEQPSMKAILHEALTDGVHLVLIGALLVGFVSGPAGGEAMGPFVNDVFKGFLAFFLLEMGLIVARQLREARDVGPFLVGSAIVMPLIGASMVFLLGSIVRLSSGDMAVLAVLAASGSYITTTAVLRYAIPEARPSKYFTMSLGVTFPFNIIVGIPLYSAIAERLGT